MRSRIRLVTTLVVILLTLLAVPGGVLAHGGDSHDAAGSDPAEPTVAEPSEAGEHDEAAPSDGHNDAAQPHEEGAAGGSTGLEPISTTLALSVVPSGERTGTIEARLTGAAGEGLSGKAVNFSRATSFGTLDLGEVTTDSAGVARLDIPLAPGQEIKVSARFAGTAELAGAESTAAFSVPPAPVVDRRGLTTRYPNPWFVALLALVVGGVWFTYGFVFWTVGRIPHAGREALETGETLPEPRTAD